MKNVNICNWFFRNIILFGFVVGDPIAVMAMQELSSDIIMIENPGSNNNNINENQSQLFSNLRNQLMVGLLKNHPEMIIDAMDKFLELIPLDYQGNASESFYHSLMYIFFLSTGYDVQAERPSGDGYSDMMVIPRDKSRFYIFEYKISDPRHIRSRELSAADFTKNIMICGMRQIFDNDYYGMYHQCEKPFTFFAGLFARRYSLTTYKTFSGGATRDDQGLGGFKNISSLVLGVVPSPITLRLSKIQAGTEALVQIYEKTTEQGLSKIMVKHTLYKKYLTLDSFDEILIKKSNNFDQAMNTPRDYEEPINFKKIREALNVCDMPKFLKNIDCLLKSVPLKLRGVKTEYYQALLLAIFYAAGLDVKLEADHFMIKISDKIYRIWTEFSSGKTDDMIKALIEDKFKSCVHTCQVKDEFFIGLNVNQPGKEIAGIKRKMTSSVHQDKRKALKEEQSQNIEEASAPSKASVETKKEKEGSQQAKGTSKRELRGYALRCINDSFFCLDDNKTAYNFSGAQTSLQLSSPVTPQKPYVRPSDAPKGAPRKLEFEEK